jgi:FkbH-like protein
VFEEKKLSYYMTEASSISDIKFDKKIRIAILGSFTINGLEETLRVKCAQEKIEFISYVAGYNQYAQEILNTKSNLYKFAPDITFLILDTRSIMGNFFYSPYSLNTTERKEFAATKTDELLKLIDTFTKNSDSKIVVTNFNIPCYSPYGIIETKTEFGMRDMIREINSKLSSNLVNERSVFVYDFSQFMMYYGEANVFDYRKFLLGDIKISLDFIPHLANDLMSYIKAILGINKKCIVLDLDNTLWGGVVGEDGFDGIKLGPTSPGNAFVEFQQCLLSYWQRGIILAINSKNNYDDAMQVIRDHPYMILREKHFASMRINWNDKVSNLKEIANELNIGLNSIAYFDDDPVNREFVSSTMSEVLVVNLPEDPSLYAQALTSLNDFNVLQITDEDLSRGKMYLEQKARKELETSATNLDEFLKQLDIKITMKGADQSTIPRISQLTLKTNQFNLTTKRYQEEDIIKFSQGGTKLIGCAKVEDKFGDNGITGVFIVDKESPSEWNIDTFLLSCRVLGRGVEDAILGHILQKAKSEGVKKVKGTYIPTKKNMPCEHFLSNYGFSEEDKFWSYSLNNPVKMPDYIKMVIE